MISRRKMLAAIPAGAALLLDGCKDSLPPSYGSLFDASNSLTFASHRLLLRNQPLVREFSRDKITPSFPAINTISPEDPEYLRLQAGGFSEWRLPVAGLVVHPAKFSVDDLRRLPSRTQVTQHNCEQGWSAIAEWTGVPLGRILQEAGMLPEARYVVFHTVDGWWDSLDMLDALHPQTLLAYGMNGGALPVAHGAPVRLRVERQLGYKSLKYLSSVDVTDRLDNIEDGTGAVGAAHGYSWYAGI
ncbi:MAG TPA: molybdopterin-dependent oxidoreductase [Bryobacteraceae bacterium]|jgi:DMSO/TMAO reductase YedYZ molybdopterin-dependent catalytic subunit